MPAKMLDLRDKQHPSCELPERIQREWHLPYTNDKNREECKRAGMALKARMEELMTDKSKGGLGDLPEKLKDCGLKRAFHDELGVRKVVFTFCDDMLTTVYKLESTWAMFEKEMVAVFKAAGVNPKHVIRCLLAELGPGVSIPVHHDTGYWATRSHRVHMPLITSTKVEFYTGKTEDALTRVPFPEFELVELNNRAKHMVKNSWDKPRVHLIFDFVEDHQVPLLTFKSLIETDVIRQTRRTITIVKVSEEKKEDELEQKDDDVLIPLQEDESARKQATQELLARIRKAHSPDSALGNRFVREFCKLSKRYSDGEMQAGEYVAFLDRAFLNRDSAKEIVGLLYDRERAKALWSALMKPMDAPTVLPVSSPEADLKLFVIAGAMKCGTTSLFEYINEHPDCVRARQKEPHAFDWVWNQLCALPGETLREKYMRAFDVDQLRAGNDGKKRFTGEATPSYLLGGAELFKRLKAACSNVKILVILREPAERAWSHYRMTADTSNVSPEQLVRRGTVDGKSFPELIEQDLQTIADCKIDALETIASEFEASYLSGLPTGHGSHAYVGRGLYALQIELLLQVFPRQQVLFLKLEDLAKDHHSQMDRVLSFLEVPTARIVEPKKHNERGTVNATKTAADEAMLKRLREFYKPHNARLQRLLPELSFEDWGT